ncbi:MAG: bacillithiol biosynthesis cysteine-adding enzyme BshC [Polaribacter sp.]
MKITQIPFKNTGFFSKIMIDYLEQKEVIEPFYNNFPDIKGFHNQIEEKQKSYRLQSRMVLVEALKNQYKIFDSARNESQISDKTIENIGLLKQQNTFTITTGHQLNLFTGPLYFLYKIISAINLAEELSEKFPAQNFVPIYWMATEDHDFDEINYFNFERKKVRWNREDGGAVGRFSTEGLKNVFEVFSNQLGNSKNAKKLKELFSQGYLKHNNLAVATRFIANKLFTEYGLVIIDGDDKKLKKAFIPFIKDELEKQTSFAEVSKTILALEKNYKIQVNPREINLFYLGKNTRERIIFKDGIYKVNNTNITFSKAEILKEAEQNPLVFSPNVIMRPLYQEVILPNLCYIGGGGEMAYWFELKAYFNKVNIPFPILLLRNSVQVISKKQQKKLHNLHISHEEIFLNQHKLLSKKVVENSDIQICFTDKIQYLKNQFLELKEVAKKTDVSFIGAVNAQEKKQLKGLENLHKRLLKAEKRRQNDLVERITELQNTLLPNQSLEERQRNFSEYYLEYGDCFVTALKEALKPLQLEFTILEL